MGLRMSTVVIFDLCEDRVFESTSPVGQNLWDDFVLTGAEFEDLGPLIEDIVIHSEGSNFTANYSYRVVLQYKFRNGPWQDADSSAVVLQALQTSGNYVISTPYSTRTKFGMKIRIVLQTQIVTGTTNVQKGNLTVSAAVRFFGS
jgi:hypothetical protein